MNSSSASTHALGPIWATISPWTNRHSDEVIVTAPLALADDFQTSRHATIRYYVENHPDRLSLVVGGRYLGSGSVPIWTGVESVGFRARYGSVAPLVGKRLAAVEGSEIGGLVAEAMRSSGVVRGKVTVSDRSGHTRSLTTEAFFNQHCTFFLLAETGWIPVGNVSSLPERCPENLPGLWSSRQRAVDGAAIQCFGPPQR